MRILRPPDRSVLPSGPLEIAVAIPSGAEHTVVTLDGQELKPSALPRTERVPAHALAKGIWLPPVLIVIRSLSPGPHKLSAGDTTVQFFVCDENGNKTPPGQWSRYRAHPPPRSREVTCIACHKLSDQQRFTDMDSAFSRAKPSACFNCHDRGNINLRHAHSFESLAFCQLCHDPHGSSDDKLLKMPAAKACTLCHE